MTASHRLVVVLAGLLVACGDDASVTTDTDDSTGDESTTNGTVTNPTTTIDPSTTTMQPSTSAATETDTDDSSTTEPDTTTTDPDTTTTDSSSSSTSGGPGECGDGRVNADEEECDEDDLDLMNCVALDFDGGELACTGACLFDTSGCTTCGDGAIEGQEECDMMVGAATCVSEGFVSGDLGCFDDCTFDVSDCNSCGNDMVDAGEDCDGDDLGGNACGDIGMGFTGGTLTCSAGCGFDTTGCTSFALPGTGEVVINEIMFDSTTVADPDGEWFEVHNPSGATTYQLAGCTIEGNMNDNGFVVVGDFEIPPGAYTLFGDDTALDPGIVANYEWPGGDFSLNNSSDRVAIVCDATLVDEVAYDNGATFPDPSGASISLDPAFLDATANDAGANWCAATQSYNGDLGTPGAVNPACDAETTYDIDFCRLQFPLVIDDTEGTDIDVFGRLYIAGLTDVSGGNDPAAEVIGYVGYGPDGSDPAVDATWVWTTGTPNVGYGPASPSYEMNNDEYIATLNVPSPGTYDFAFRFSGDSGATFTYCDGGDPGSSDGYAAADAGQMTASAAPPPPNMYFSEYVEGSSNNKAIEIFNADVVSGDLDNCAVRIYSNGNMNPSNTIDLAGTLDAGATYVVCDDDIGDPTPCDLLATGGFWNGNDAVELACGSTTLDVLGQIGNDPGAEWVAGGVGTQNETLRRDCAVTTGDTDGTDAFDPSAEWDTFAIDSFGDLGLYDCP